MVVLVAGIHQVRPVAAPAGRAVLIDGRGQPAGPIGPRPPGDQSLRSSAADILSRQSRRMLRSHTWLPGRAGCRGGVEPSVRRLRGAVEGAAPHAEVRVDLLDIA